MGGNFVFFPFWTGKWQLRKVGGDFVSRAVESRKRERERGKLNLLLSHRRTKPPTPLSLFFFPHLYRVWLYLPPGSHFLMPRHISLIGLFGNPTVQKIKNKKIASWPPDIGSVILCPLWLDSFHVVPSGTNGGLWSSNT